MIIVAAVRIVASAATGPSAARRKADEEVICWGWRGGSHYSFVWGCTGVPDAVRYFGFPPPAGT